MPVAEKGDSTSALAVGLLELLLLPSPVRLEAVSRVPRTRTGGDHAGHDDLSVDAPTDEHSASLKWAAMFGFVREPYEQRVRNPDWRLQLLPQHGHPGWRSSAKVSQTGASSSS